MSEFENRLRQRETDFARRAEDQLHEADTKLYERVHYFQPRTSRIKMLLEILALLVLVGGIWALLQWVTQ